jgi:hypothetical protein
MKPEHGTAPYGEGAAAETQTPTVGRILEQVPPPRQGREATYRTQWVHEVKDSDLSRSTKLVALTLAAWMDTSGLCWPSITTIAQGAGLKPRATILHLGKLDAAGYIRRQKGGGRGISTRYQATCKTVHGDSLNSARGRPETVHPHAHEVKEKYLKPSPKENSARNNGWEPPNPRPKLLSPTACEECGGWAEHRVWCPWG